MTGQEHTIPSPCQDYAEQELDLNEYLIAHRASTFFLRAQGNSMQDVGLYDGACLSWSTPSRRSTTTWLSRSAI